MNHKFEKRVKRIYAMLSCFVLVAVMTVCPAFAADDPLAVVTNLSDFIFFPHPGHRLILLGFGVLQLGLSLKSHDPSARQRHAHHRGRHCDHVYQGDPYPHHRLSGQSGRAHTASSRSLPTRR